MKVKSLVNALEKEGLQIETTFHGPNKFYICKTDKMKLTWYGSEYNEEASCVHVSRINDEWRPDIDSFPGFFVDTIKAAIKYLLRKD